MASQPLRILGRDVEVVEDYKYLGVTINHRLEWRSNTEALLQEGGEQTIHPEEAEILQCVQQDVGDLLSVCGGQCTFLCCSLLGEQHQRQ